MEASHFVNIFVFTAPSTTPLHPNARNKWQTQECLLLYRQFVWRRRVTVLLSSGSWFIFRRLQQWKQFQKPAKLILWCQSADMFLPQQCKPFEFREENESLEVRSGLVIDVLLGCFPHMVILTGRFTSGMSGNSYENNKWNNANEQKGELKSHCIYAC